MPQDFHTCCFATPLQNMLHLKGVNEADLRSPKIRVSKSDLMYFYVSEPTF